MTRSRGLLAAVAVACLLLPSPAAELPGTTDLADQGRLTLSGEDNAKVKRKLQALEDYVKSEDWETAARVAQELLDRPSDVFVQGTVKGADGKPVERLLGVRVATNRLLAGLPEKGRNAYEKMYGEKAAKLLARAHKESDRQLLIEVAQRYRHTKAGREASEELRKAVKEPPATPNDWPMFGGTPSRDGQGYGGAPFLQPYFRHSLFASDSGRVKRWISGDEASVVKRLEAKGEAVIPAFVPVTASVPIATGNDRQKTLIVYRDYNGIVAVSLKTGKREWIAHSHWSPEGMLRDGQTAPSLTGWVSQFKDTLNRPGVLIENATIGTLSSDGKRVYLIDDLQVPPLADPQAERPDSSGVNKWVKPGVDANKLQAINLASGKMYWELGGAGTGDDGKPKHDFRDSYFLGAPLPLDSKLYFLNEKDQEIRLVCLDTGKLAARDPQPKDLDAAILWVQPLGRAKEKILADYGRRINGAPIAYGEGVLVCPTNTGVLVGVDALTHDLLWAHAYVEDPDAVPGGVGPPPFHPVTAPVREWKASAPIVQAGKVVFALPDGPELRCLDLRDGRRLWGSQRRDDDVYLGGVIAGRVLVVGKKDVRALALDDGKELWRVPTGMPSGRGAASGNVFYLPLRDTVGNTGPEIVAIDVAKGRAIAHTHARKDLRSGTVAVPGNIIFSGGSMISQSATDLVAYPLLKTKLKLLDEELKKDPKSPRGLFERGELRHERGDLLGAVEDYRAALANDPPAELRPKLNDRLFDALTELLRQDFGAGQKYLKECEGLIRAPIDPKAPADVRAEWEAESLRRRAGLLAIKGRGYESQGKAVDALNAYLALAALKETGLRSVVDDPALKASPAVWARGRIATLYAGAKAPSRQLLDEEIGKKGAALRPGKDTGALRAFVALFAPKVAAGREEQLELAERLLMGDRAAQLDAEALLLQLSAQADDRQQAAQALEALARLMVHRRLLEDALHYYQRLARDYPTTVIRDGKKGAEYLDDLATDKRFLPYLAQAPAAGKVRWRAELTTTGKLPMQPPQLLCTFTPQGEVVPSLLRLRVAVNEATNSFKLIDRRTGVEQVSLPLTVNFRSLLHASLNTVPPALYDHLGYHAAGHVLILNLGEWVMAVDAVGRRVLWERNLLAAPRPVARQEYRIDPEDGSLHVLNPDGTVARVAQLGPVGAGLVVLLSPDGLSAIDVLTGETAWQRSDVPSRSAVFGDGERLYVVGRGADGKATGTRAFRARDGVAVAVPDFAAAFDHRLRVVGGEVLVAEKPAAGLVLRLYDVAAGKDVWSQKFVAGSVVMHAHDTDLAGVIDPSGRVHVLSLRQRKVVFGGIVDVEHLKNLKEAHLLADSQHVYVVLDTKDPKAGDVVLASNLQPFSGLRGITVNGMVYAFDRRAGKTRWWNEIRNQQLVLGQWQWQELPVLLFTSRDRGAQIAIEVYDKATGKLYFRSPARSEPSLDPRTSGPIYAVNYDPGAVKIELLANTYQLTITKAP